MTLYEINTALAELLDGSIDPETGELIVDEAALEALNMARDEKRESYALYIKNERADIVALKAEKDAIDKRIKSKTAHVERVMDILARDLDGEKFETARCAVSFRNNKAVHIDPNSVEQFKQWAALNGHNDYLRIKPVEVNKEAVRKALMAGAVMPFASLEQTQSMTIK